MWEKTEKSSFKKNIQKKYSFAVELLQWNKEPLSFASTLLNASSRIKYYYTTTIQFHVDDKFSVVLNIFNAEILKLEWIGKTW